MEEGNTLTLKEETNIALPRSISSTHVLCQSSSSKVVTNIDLQNALDLYNNGNYKEARIHFETLCNKNEEAKYYLAVMYYDKLGGRPDYEKAVRFMNEIINNQHSGSLRCCAFYNIGRAYYEGFGVKQSDIEAEKHWLLSAKGDCDSDTLHNNGCVKSQSILGMFYARKGEETFSLKKSHYWHQEATGNGSLESQGALGVMYEYGIGVKQDIESSFKCFKAAAERGNVYAIGNLSLHYYKNKMFNNACDTAKRVADVEDAKLISIQTDCVELFVRKGISLGCFVYARCIERGIVDDDNEDPAIWYSKAAVVDSDTAQDMQDLVTHGII